jgi:hypothetical protein
MREVSRHEITRFRKTAAEPIGLGFKAPTELTCAASPARLHSSRMGRPGRCGLPD